MSAVDEKRKEAENTELKKAPELYVEIPAENDEKEGGVEKSLSSKSRRRSFTSSPVMMGRRRSSLNMDWPLVRRRSDITARRGSNASVDSSDSSFALAVLARDVSVRGGSMNHLRQRSTDSLNNDDSGFSTSGSGETSEHAHSLRSRHSSSNNSDEWRWEFDASETAEQILREKAEAIFSEPYRWPLRAVTEAKESPTPRSTKSFQFKQPAIPKAAKKSWLKPAMTDLWEAVSNYFAEARACVEMIGILELIEISAYVGLLGSLDLLSFMGISSLAGLVILGVSILSFFVLYELSCYLDESPSSFKHSEDYLEKLVFHHEDAWLSSRALSTRFKPTISLQPPSDTGVAFTSPLTQQSPLRHAGTPIDFNSAKSADSSNGSFVVLHR